MRYRKNNFIAVILMATGLWPGAVMAAPPAGGDVQIYVVQADDRLGKLADKFYGTPLAYPAIVEATNMRANRDTRFGPIDEPYQLEIGQALVAPTFDKFPEALLAQAPLEKVVMPEEVVVTHDALTKEQEALLSSLNVVGKPPELHNEIWLNSEPLKLADLHDKVVIVEFWTFG